MGEVCRWWNSFIEGQAPTNLPAGHYISLVYQVNVYWICYGYRAVPSKLCLFVSALLKLCLFSKSSLGYLGEGI